MKMQEHENTSDLLRRQPESHTRVTCGESPFLNSMDMMNDEFLFLALDACSTPIFSSSFLCVVCGYEVCDICHSKKNAELLLCNANREV